MTDHTTEPLRFFRQSEVTAVNLSHNLSSPGPLYFPPGAAKIWVGAFLPMLTSNPMQPEATILEFFGWNLTVHGVLGCPRNVWTTLPCKKLVILTV